MKLIDETLRKWALSWAVEENGCLLTKKPNEQRSLKGFQYSLRKVMSTRNGVLYGKTIYCSCGETRCINPNHLSTNSKFKSSVLISSKGRFCERKRFLEKVKKTKSCWLWRSHGAVGYGYFSRGLGERGELAHRASYRIFKGSIPSGLIVRHTCHVRHCVNPKHLIVGTAKENHKDMVLAGRWVPRPTNDLAKKRRAVVVLKEIELTSMHKLLLRLSSCLRSGEQKIAWKKAITRSNIDHNCVLTPAPHYFIMVNGRDLNVRKIAAQIQGIDSSFNIASSCDNAKCINPKHMIRKMDHKPIKYRPNIPIKDVIERFKSQIIINPKTNCHEFQGGLRNGYGMFFFNPEGKKIYAHRAAILLKEKAIPEGMIVRHICHNPRCVNTKHLKVGTHKENSADMIKAGRHWASRIKSNS